MKISACTQYKNFVKSVFDNFQIFPRLFLVETSVMQPLSYPTFLDPVDLWIPKDEQNHGRKIEDNQLTVQLELQIILPQKFSYKLGKPAMRFLIFSQNKATIFGKQLQYYAMNLHMSKFLQLSLITEKCASKWQSFFNNSKAHRITKISQNVHQKDVHFCQGVFFYFL